MLALTSVCAQEEGQSGAGSRAGTRAPERRRGDRQGVLLLAERAQGGGGRGWRAGHGAARLLGSACPRSLHRRQPPSPAKQPRGPGGCRGIKSTSSRSFPHATPRHRGLCPHTRAPTAARSLPSKKKKNQNSKPKAAGMRERGWRRCADSGVSWQPREVGGDGRGGARPSPSVCPEKPGAHGESRQDLHPEHASPLRPGARLCHRPFLTRRGPWPGGWGSSAAAGDEELGFWESDGRSREEPRRCTAAEGGWSPQQSPRILR